MTSGPVVRVRGGPPAGSLGDTPILPVDDSRCARTSIARGRRSQAQLPHSVRTSESLSRTLAPLLAAIGKVKAELGGCQAHSLSGADLSSCVPDTSSCGADTSRCNADTSCVRVESRGFGAESRGFRMESRGAHAESRRSRAESRGVRAESLGSRADARCVLGAAPRLQHPPVLRVGAGTDPSHFLTFRKAPGGMPCSCLKQR